MSLTEGRWEDLYGDARRPQCYMCCFLPHHPVSSVHLSVWLALEKCFLPLSSIPPCFRVEASQQLVPLKHTVQTQCMGSYDTHTYAVTPTSCLVVSLFPCQYLVSCLPSSRLHFFPVVRQWPWIFLLLVLAKDTTKCFFIQSHTHRLYFLVEMIHPRGNILQQVQVSVCRWRIYLNESSFSNQP